MSVNVQTVPKPGACITDNVEDGNGPEQLVWIIPALFCATKYMNDARCQEGDRIQVNS